MNNKKKTSHNYLLLGTLLGLAFPILATALVSFIEEISLFEAQKEHYLLWIINTAPLVMAVTFYFIELKQKQLDSWNKDLKRIIEEKTSSLEEKTNVAENTAKAQSDFLANMSHEICTPLNGIIGTIHLLNTTKLDQEQKEYSNTMITSSEYLLGIINEILDYSKIDAGKMDLEYLPFNLENCLKDVVQIQQPLAQKKGLSLNIENLSLEQTWYGGDPTRIKQILVNIINNALKFTPEGGVFLSLSNKETINPKNPEGKKKSELLFQIRDTGVGIPKDKQKSVFEGFQQVDTSITRNYGGTGLGLSISSHFCHEMGGDIWIESEEGAGTSFFFTLKLDHEEPTEEKNKQDDNISNYFGLGKTHPLNILITEDNAVNQSLMLRLLEKIGYKADLAKNGQVALDMVQNQADSIPYDLIFMDIQMPVMDGITSCKEIRKLKNIKQPKIASLTASILYGDREKFAAAGMNESLTKPIKVGNLVQVIKDTPINLKASEKSNLINLQKTNKTNSEIATTKSSVQKNEYQIDVKAILNNFGGDYDILNIAVETFLECYPKTIADLKKSIKEVNFSLLQISAHTLKGTLLNFGESPASELAFQLETLGREQKTEDIQNIFNKFEKNFYLQIIEIEKLKNISIAA